MAFYTTPGARWRFYESEVAMATQSTRDHATIQHWAEERQARPALVSRTGGLLRFEFDPASGGELKPVSWDEFFQVLDAKGLELIYDDKPNSRFHKFVYPETREAEAEGKPAVTPARSRKRLQVEDGDADGGKRRGGRRAASIPSRGSASRARAASPAAGASQKKASGARTKPKAAQPPAPKPRTKSKVKAPQRTPSGRAA